MGQERTYPGLHHDRFGGMTDIGRVIRDAWVLGILPEGETCEGWAQGRLQRLYEEVHEAWRPYGHLASRLPEDLRERHRRIYDEAVRRAKALGWQPPLESDED